MEAVGESKSKGIEPEALEKQAGHVENGTTPVLDPPEASSPPAIPAASATSKDEPKHVTPSDAA